MTIAKAMDRIGSSVSGRLRSLRGHPALNADARRELRNERRGAYPADSRAEPHIIEAVEWLCRAQDATADDGIARGFGLIRDPYFGWRGWQPSYPETTGYIIPTLYAAADRFGRPDLAARAGRAAVWEIDIQLPNGAVRGGVIGQSESPAVFNTGQVMLGWLAALERTGDGRFRDAVRRAGHFLVEALGTDAVWVHGRSRFAHGGAELYNARTAWALTEAGILLNEQTFSDAAHRMLHAVAARQHENGWFPDCCLNDPTQPLLHTIAYTIRGLLEGGRLSADDTLLGAAARAAGALHVTVTSDGRMPGRFRHDWTAAVEWSCLTGQAQMANNWLRLHAITGDPRWLEPVPRVLAFLKGTQSRDATAASGIRGGIKGSNPLSGAYGRFEVLSWATKFFADALMRWERHEQGGVIDERRSHLA